MYIGRYYVDKKKWISAINRFRVVVDDYETTIYTRRSSSSISRNLLCT